MYGEFDEYEDVQKAHLVPALISKFHLAKETNQPEVELYGDGTPLRQFTLSDDVAKIICQMLNNFKTGKYNIACPDNLPISEIIKIVKDVVGYEGNIKYNGQANGVYRKDVDCNKISKQYPNIEFTPLKDGVKYVYNKVKEEILCGK